MRWTKAALDPFTLAKIEHVLKSWQGTPYKPYHQEKGKGVDCVRFVMGVLDELQGVPHGRLSGLELIPDQAMHDKEKASRLVESVIRRYAPMRRRKIFRELVPGDVLICAQTGGGPGHAIICGALPYRFWHATNSGVGYTGIAILDKWIPTERVRIPDLWEKR